VQKIASSISLIQGRFAASLPKLTDGDVLLVYTFALLAGGVIRRVQNTYLHAEERTTFFSAATQINAGELLAFFAIATVLRCKIDPVRFRFLQSQFIMSGLAAPVTFGAFGVRQTVGKITPPDRGRELRTSSSHHWGHKTAACKRQWRRH
jgi:hypothetical protein